MGAVIPPLHQRTPALATAKVATNKAKASKAKGKAKA
jgi:hypothetical protein